MHHTAFPHRNACTQDFDAIVAWPQDAVELRNLFPRARWPADQAVLAGHLAEHNEGIVLTDHRDTAIAYASFYGIQQRGRVWIGHLIVHPAWRRQGLGAQLLAVMSRLAGQDFAATELATICFADNAAARVFYQRQGFRSEGWETRLDHHDEPTRVLRLVRALPAGSAASAAPAIQAK